MEIQSFVFALLKLTKTFFSAKPKFLFIPKVGSSPSTKKFFLQMSARDDQLLSTPKLIRFLVDPLAKLQKPALSNVIM